MRTTMRVIQGRLAESEPHRTSAIEDAEPLDAMNSEQAAAIGSSPSGPTTHERLVRQFGSGVLRPSRDEVLEILSAE